MPEFRFFPTTGEMAQRIRHFDWAATPLGPVAAWPTELKSAVGFLLESRFPGAIVWGPSLTTIYNDAFAPILGNKPDALGRSFAEVWAEVWPDLRPLIEKVYAGESVFIENYPLLIERGKGDEQAYFTFCYAPLRMADGSIGGMMDTVVETTDAVNAHAERKLINEELNHRLKNTIAVVQAISRQTLRDNKRDEVEAFNNRIAALGTAHDVLTQQSWVQASVQTIMSSVLTAICDRTRIDITGCDLDVGPKAVLSLSLLLNELATNATKHGALSNNTGRVRVHCETTDGDFSLIWEESGGPVVTEPARKGFGSRIIDMGLGGPVTREFRPDGVVIRATAKIRDLQKV